MSQEEAGLAQEQLEELAWDAPLTLMRRDSYPEELWMLEQRGRRVAAITRTTRWPPDGDWSLTTAAQCWNADIRRRRRPSDGMSRSHHPGRVRRCSNTGLGDKEWRHARTRHRRTVQTSLLGPAGLRLEPCHDRWRQAGAHYTTDQAAERARSRP